MSSYVCKGDGCGRTVPNGENCPDCVTFHRPETRKAREAHARARHRAAALAAGVTNPDSLPKTLDILRDAPPAILAEHPGAKIRETIDVSAEKARATAAMEIHESGSAADMAEEDSPIREADTVAESDKPKEAHVREEDMLAEAQAIEARAAAINAERAAARAALVSKLAAVLAEDPKAATKLAREHGVSVVFEALSALSGV